MPRIVEIEERIVRFWYRSADPRPLAIVRISFMIAALCNIGLHWTDRKELLYPNGMFGLEAIRQLPFTLSLFEFVQTGTQIDFLFLFAFLAILGVGFGFMTRVSTVLSFVWHFSYVGQLQATISGWDYLHVIVNFVLMISPCAAVWSLDARRRAKKGRPSITEIPIYPYRIMQWQFMLMFVTTTWLKIHNYPWQHGVEFGHFFLCGYSNIRTTLFIHWAELNNFMTHLTLFIELVIPFFLWNRRTRIFGYGMFLGLMAGIATSKVAIYPLITMTLSWGFLQGHDIDNLQRFYRGNWSERFKFLKDSFWDGIFFFFGKEFPPTKRG